MVCSKPWNVPANVMSQAQPIGVQFSAVIVISSVSLKYWSEKELPALTIAASPARSSSELISHGSVFVPLPLNV